MARKHTRVRERSRDEERTVARARARARASRGPELLREGRTCYAIAPARSAVIVDAEEYYRDLADAIESARSYVLLTGWQLESTAWLRRRSEDEGRPQTLAEVVRAACERNPALHVYVLAWDWSTVYALDREWGTAQKLREAGLGRLHFLYDAQHAQGASHHDKLAVVDGHTAWVGGIDVCEHRWDQRSHLDGHPLRLDRDGTIHLPYHDVQSVVRGPVVRALVEHFVERWIAAGGEPMVLVPEPEPREWPHGHVELGRTLVGVARTRGGMVLPLREAVHEIRDLYVRAIESAEHLVYVESQYVTSRAIVEALARRMRERRGGGLEIVCVMPHVLEGRMEKAAIEVPQRVALTALARVARENGHGFGAYSPCVPRRDGDGKLCPTYVHTKLMIVDDRFLTIGSANATNRSMGLDSELNLAWEAPSRRTALARAIRALRVSLLAEHTRLEPREAVRALTPIPGLARRLARVAERCPEQLVAVELDRETEKGPLDELLAELGDPERAALAENVFEEILERPQGVVARLVTALHDLAGQRA